MPTPKQLNGQAGQQAPKTATAYIIKDPASATGQPELHTMQVRAWRHGFKVFSASYSPHPDFIPNYLSIGGACETPDKAWDWYIQLQLCRINRAQEAEALAKQRLTQARAAISRAQA